MKKYIQIKDGKEIPFVFESKEKELEYIEKCLTLWGAIVCNVTWAMQTNLYEKIK